jgi:hypothetical protein
LGFSFADTYYNSRVKEGTNMPEVPEMFQAAIETKRSAIISKYGQEVYDNLKAGKYPSLLSKRIYTGAAREEEILPCTR